jgi:glycerol-3-phosphate dehydrogenase subunit C
MERFRVKNPDIWEPSILYCNNCKRCDIACPSGVQLSDMITRAKLNYAYKKFRPRDYLLSHTDIVGKIATRFSTLVNFINRRFIVKWLLKVFFKIDSPTLPEYAKGTFDNWRKKQPANQKKMIKHVVYFSGCYVNYNDHDLGKAVIYVFEAMNIGVVVAKQKCCGIPLISNGFVRDAKKNARFNIRWLSTYISDTQTKIVSSSSTCLFTLKYDYPNILGIDNLPIAGRLEYITRYIAREFDSGNIPAMRPLGLKVVYHSPCHLERMGGVLHTIRVLKAIPGLDLTVLHSECCGIAGTYGYKKEFSTIARDIGSDIFKKIKALQPDQVVTDCETCKWQIEMNTGYQTVHPVTLLSQALKQG